MLIVDCLFLEKAFFLEGANSVSADFNFHLFAIHGKRFSLQIRLPDLFGMALGKADVMAVLFAFFIKFKSLHNSVDYFNRGNSLSQLN